MRINIFGTGSRGTPSPEALPLRVSCHYFTNAFSRLELCVVVATLTLLVGIALPALANKPRSQQVACFNNLRQIGRAFQVWANDHDDLIPPYVPISEGGTQYQPSTATWVQFGALSNELVSPKVLACPSDNKRPASEFSLNSKQGLFHANFRNSAVSYFIGHPYQQYPHDILSGDRNLSVSAINISCAVYGDSSAAQIILSPSSLALVGWTNNIHMNSGNLLHSDGQVEILPTDSLRRALSNLREGRGNLHLLMP